MLELFKDAKLLQKALLLGGDLSDKSAEQNVLVK